MPQIDDDLKDRIGNLLRSVNPPDPAFLAVAHRRRQRVKVASRIGLSIAVVGVTVGAFVFVRSQVRSEHSLAPVTPPIPSFENGEIAFSEGGDLFAIGAQGDHFRQLTSGPEEDRFPSWSPGGNELAFLRELRVTVLDLGSGEVRAISPDGLAAYRPAWSPDGRWIAFSGVGRPGIYIVRPDGSGLRSLTDDSFNAPDNAVWSPDSTTIAFGSNLSDGDGGYVDGWDTYTVEVNGSNLTNITHTPDPQSSELPVGWLPNGNILVSTTPNTIASGPGEPPQMGAWQEYTANGGRVRTIREYIVNSRGAPQEPSLSPDGRYAIFDADRGEGAHNVWTLELATDEVAQVTSDGGAMADWERVPVEPQSTPSTDASTILVPAQPGEATLVLSDFEIQFPYVDPSGETDREAAGVSYTSGWATDLNPGTVRCRLQAFAGNGDPVGETTFQLTDNNQEPSRWDNRVEVPVTAKPSSVEGYCGAADPDQARALYEITDLRIEGDNLYGSVTWLNGIEPLEQFCRATFERADGTSKVVPFSLMAPQGDQVILLLGAKEAGELTPVSAQCEPFAGQPDLTDEINRLKDDSQS